MGQRPLANLTIIVPFYRNCGMLERQIEEWNQYPDDVTIICVDDGSPEPALPIIESGISEHLRSRVQVYRIGVDIPWNREGARNLGAHVASTEWILHVDIDHILPVDCCARLLAYPADPAKWYRFPRWRIGRADETRKKDQIPPELERGQIKPHIDSYIVTRDVYWKVGGYDEDYSGCLGGGNAFLRRLEQVAELALLPEDIHLHVYTRDKIKDASDWSLSRDTRRGKEIFKRKSASGMTAPKNPLRFPWERVL